MRLRLTVQRNGLPASNVLWSVPDTNSGSAYTITRLLEDVNLIIPLEAEHWGLEHYIVEVDGFECFHFSPVAQALKENDHISIRPLMTAEIRARTLTGRHQVSNDGRHLVDGIPFGRPYLREPNRPAVSIPPRKRRRLDINDNDEDTHVEAEVAGLLTANGRNVRDQVKLSKEETKASSVKGTSQPVLKSVHFERPEAEWSNGSDDDDEDFENNGSSEDNSSADHNWDDTSDSQQDSVSESGSESDSKSKPQARVKEPVRTSIKRSADLDSGSTSSSSSDTDSTSSSDASSDSESGAESDASSPVTLSSKHPFHKPQTMVVKSDSPKHVPPGKGKESTQRRNVRRAKVNRLRRLKTSGELHGDADLNDLQRYDEARASRVELLVPSKSFWAPSGKRKQLVDSPCLGDRSSHVTREFRPSFCDNEETPKTVVQAERALEQRKKWLMSKLEGQIVSDTGSSSSPHTPGHEIAISAQPVNSIEATPKNSSGDARRLRPNTSAIKRILAREAVSPMKKKPKAEVVIEKPSEPEGAADPDFWKSKINLSAFECWEEDFDLSTPPFPFRQYWDLASKSMRDNASKKRQKRNRSHTTASNGLEEEEENIILDYDNELANGTIVTGLSCSAVHEDLENQTPYVQADVPPLPNDISTLPKLTPANITNGAVIVCKFFAVNPITVTPEITNYKAATVTQEGDSGRGAGTIQLRIAQRDLIRREKKFDGEGNRIYDSRDRFFMSNDDETEDEDIWEGKFSELLEARLLRAA